MDVLAPVGSGAVAPSRADSVIAPMGGLQSAAIEDQLVVLDPASGRRVLLNASAALIFTAIDTERRLGDVVDQIARETGADRDDIASDVGETVDRLLAQQMLSRDDLAAGDGQSGLTRADPVTATEPEASNDLPDPAGVRDWSFDSGVRTVAGTAVTVRAEPPSLAGDLRRAMVALPAAQDTDATHRIEVVREADTPDGVTEDGRPGPDSVRIVVDGVARTRPLGVDRAIAGTFDELDALLAEYASGLRFHAGAVERDGHVVVVVGQSGHGKSTLTAALVKAGWGYLTDELVVVDPTTAWVQGYARPFDLDDAALAALDIDRADLVTGITKNKVLPSRLGSTSDGGRIVLIVLLTGRATKPEDPLVVPDAEALMALLPVVFARTFDAPDALARLAQLCESSRVIRLGRSPLGEMVATIEREAARVLPG